MTDGASLQVQGSPSASVRVLLFHHGR
jgi:hypothetical protein